MRLTRARSPVRSRVKTYFCSFFFFFPPHIFYVWTMVLWWFRNIWQGNLLDSWVLNKYKNHGLNEQDLCQAHLNGWQSLAQDPEDRPAFAKIAITIWCFMRCLAVWTSIYALRIDLLPIPLLNSIWTCLLHTQQSCLLVIFVTMQYDNEYCWRSLY